VLRRSFESAKFANGLAFHPDGTLFVGETLTGNVYRYDLSQSKPQRKVFGNTHQTGNFPDWSGPDGMAFGEDGRLYCAVYGQRGISVLGDDGKLADVIRTNGSRPTNIAFVGHTNNAIVTEVEHSAMELVEMPCAGCGLHRPHLDL
jgi:gluconolactonase